MPMTKQQKTSADRGERSPAKMMTDDDIFKMVLALMALTTCGAMAVVAGAGLPI